MPEPHDEYVELPGREPGGRPLRVHYCDWGGDGTPLVLLHGLSSSCRIWDLTAPLLAHDFRVVAVDQRGHGLTDRPDSDYTFEEVCGDLGALLGALGFERPILVGHSWGGSVVLQFAAERPLDARGLVLVDGGFIELSERLPWKEAERVMRPPEIDGTPVDTFLGFMRRWPQMRDIWRDELGEMILSNFVIRGGKVYRRLTIPNHMKIARSLYNLNALELLRHLECPTLAISCDREAAGEAERQWQDHRREGLERLREVAPEVRVQVMEDTIHDVPVQRPAELAGLIAAFGKSLA